MSPTNTPTPKSAFSTGAWQDDQKKQQQPAAPQPAATPTATPAQPATGSSMGTAAAPTTSNQPARSYYGEQSLAAPQPPAPGTQTQQSATSSQGGWKPPASMGQGGIFGGLGQPSGQPAYTGPRLGEQQSFLQQSAGSGDAPPGGQQGSAPSANSGGRAMGNPVDIAGSAPNEMAFNPQSSGGHSATTQTNTSPFGPAGSGASFLDFGTAMGGGTPAARDAGTPTALPSYMPADAQRDAIDPSTVGDSATPDAVAKSNSAPAEMGRIPKRQRSYYGS